MAKTWPEVSQRTTLSTTTQAATTAIAAWRSLCTLPMGSGKAVDDVRPEAPVGADCMLAGRLAEHLELQPLQIEDARLSAEVLQLRAMAAASRGVIEPSGRP